MNQDCTMRSYGSELAHAHPEAPQTVQDNNFIMLKTRVSARPWLFPFLGLGKFCGRGYICAQIFGSDKHLSLFLGGSHSMHADTMCKQAPVLYKRVFHTCTPTKGKTIVHFENVRFASLVVRGLVRKTLKQMRSVCHAPLEHQCKLPCSEPLGMSLHMPVYLASNVLWPHACNGDSNEEVGQCHNAWQDKWFSNNLAAWGFRYSDLLVISKLNFRRAWVWLTTLPHVQCLTFLPLGCPSCQVRFNCLEVAVLCPSTSNRGSSAESQCPKAGALAFDDQTSAKLTSALPLTKLQSDSA
eukprot:5797604-Amphidinium_carterae.1